MNKLFIILTAFLLMNQPPVTAEAGSLKMDRSLFCENTETIDLGNGYTIEYDLKEISSNARANTKKASKTATCKHNGKIIATVTLTASFSYTGSSASCTSASATYSTYDGWVCSNKSTSRNKNTATTSAQLSKGLNYADISVTMSCSGSGVIS